ncbi:MAG: four helix bundle protein [Opitutales bacterium]|jgi:four helix bundle protein|nr:four helix bundle protein [Opitutales bacterium]MDP4642890.1 four helix bundle protein [Opitutales bacterium]MDP4776578.1 four helix bundle protein [Opitutales bacterium]MDP4878287.1 four helix bundle protein [Opitutales bacterium]MDP4882739.1 four helix bundle protein [Opitutales bacterium]
MEKLKDFVEMKVWQDAQNLAAKVYTDFEHTQDFSFTNQIKRAAISNNIAEGSERSTSTAFSRFLDIAKGSTGEVRSMYLLAVRLKHISEDIAQQRTEDCVEISKQLAGFAKYLRNK